MAKPRVIVVRSAKSWPATGAPDPAILSRMFARGFARLDGATDARAAVAALFRPGERVGIKINTIGGRAISTRPEVTLALTGWLAANGLPEKDLFVWDRTTRELKGAGYSPTAGRGGVRILGTDTDGVGYTEDLVSHLNVGSRFSKILTEFVTASISLAILKDHGMAGVTAGMKNYFGAVHNPNKYHDGHCDPYVAEVFDAPPVKSRHRLTVLDALVVQFHKGPSYHARWAAAYGGLVFSRDPVAADAAGWAIIEKLRAGAGLPTLRDEGRAPGYLATAERMGLGRADLAAVEVVEETVA